MHRDIFIWGSINLYLHEKYASINCLRTENVTRSVRDLPTVLVEQVVGQWEGLSNFGSLLREEVAPFFLTKAVLFHVLKDICHVPKATTSCSYRDRSTS